MLNQVSDTGSGESLVTFLSLTNFDQMWQEYCIKVLYKDSTFHAYLVKEWTTGAIRCHSDWSILEVLL